MWFSARLKYRKRMIGVQCHRLAGFFGSRLESAEDPGRGAGQERMRPHVARVHLRPEFTSLSRFFHVSGDYSMVREIDEEFFLVSRAISQLVSPCRAFDRQG